MMTLERRWTCQCGYSMNAHTAVRMPDESAKEGDLTLCGSCRKVHVRKSRRWVPASQEVLDSLDPETREVIGSIERTLGGSRQ